jgi:hypothetical protein
VLGADQGLAIGDKVVLVGDRPAGGPGVVVLNVGDKVLICGYTGTGLAPHEEKEAVGPIYCREQVDAL